MDIEKLYSGYFLPGLAKGDTQVLQYKVFFDLIYHTSKHGKEGPRQLRKDSFDIKTGPDGKHYVEINFNETTKKNQGVEKSISLDALLNAHTIINWQQSLVWSY